MPWYQGEEKKVARFLLLALLDLSPHFAETDTDGKIKESLRTGNPVDLTAKELTHNLLPSMLPVVMSFTTDHTVMNGIMRLFETTEKEE